MHHLGFTRSISRREYLLHTPDAFVRTPLPGLEGGLAIVHVAPRMGAGFAMTTLEFEAGGSLGAGPAQRFLYVLEGELQLQMPGASEGDPLVRGAFCYLPEGDAAGVVASVASRVVMFEKPCQSLVITSATSSPERLMSREGKIASAALNGDEALQVRCLLPPGFAFDFAVNTMTYAPGVSLGQVEVHYMEHGLLMLEGEGIYRLGDDWHPVSAGDVIWMAPFCPQWFAALGKAPAKYIIYKDFNRHVLA